MVRSLDGEGAGLDCGGLEMGDGGWGVWIVDWGLERRGGCSMAWDGGLGGYGVGNLHLLVAALRCSTLAIYLSMRDTGFASLISSSATAVLSPSLAERATITMSNAVAARPTRPLTPSSH